MNIKQAKRILDEHKETGCHSLLTVTRALWASGDLCGVDGHLLEAGEELQKIYQGKDLELKQIDDTDLFAIYADGEFTSYTLREVDWDEQKAAAANLTANNQSIAGYFTKEVDEILKSITSYELFSDLKLGELYIDIPTPDVLPPEEKLFDEEMGKGIDDGDGVPMVLRGLLS